MNYREFRIGELSRRLESLRREPQSPSCEITKWAVQCEMNALIAERTLEVERTAQYLFDAYRRTGQMVVAIPSEVSVASADVPQEPINMNCVYGRPHVTGRLLQDVWNAKREAYRLSELKARA